jgi:uncharacterized protein YjbI with pentapeptide repeats
MSICVETVMIMKRLGLNLRHIAAFGLGLMMLVMLWGAIAPPAAATDYNNRFLNGVDFSGQDLRDSQFKSADVRQSDFSHANLEGVTFFSANMDSVNLEAANLQFAMLGSARLTRANLHNANLEGALAMGARFNGANIDGADFTDVLLREDIQMELCDRATGTNPTTGRATRDTLLCDYL